MLSSLIRACYLIQSADVGALLHGARRSLAGKPQRNFLPTEDGLKAWVLQQDWLMLDLRGRVRSQVPLALTVLDQVITQAVPPGPTVRRAVLVQALGAAGYTKGAAEVAIHRAPYITSAGRGLLHR